MMEFHEGLQHAVMDGTIEIVRVVNPCFYWIRCSRCFTAEFIHKWLVSNLPPTTSSVKRGDRVVVETFDGSYRRGIVQNLTKENAPQRWDIFLIDDLLIINIPCTNIHKAEFRLWIDDFPQQIHLIGLFGGAPVDSLNGDSLWNEDEHNTYEVNRVMSIVSEADKVTFKGMCIDSSFTYGKIKLRKESECKNLLRILIDVGILKYYKNFVNVLMMTGCMDRVFRFNNTIKEFFRAPPVEPIENNEKPFHAPAPKVVFDHLLAMKFREFSTSLGLRTQDIPVPDIKFESFEEYMNRLRMDSKAQVLLNKPTFPSSQVMKVEYVTDESGLIDNLVDSLTDDSDNLRTYPPTSSSEERSSLSPDLSSHESDCVNSDVPAPLVLRRSIPHNPHSDVSCGVLSNSSNYNKSYCSDNTERLTVGSFEGNLHSSINETSDEGIGRSSSRVMGRGYAFKKYLNNGKLQTTFLNSHDKNTSHSSPGQLDVTAEDKFRSHFAEPYSDTDSLIEEYLNDSSSISSYDVYGDIIRVNKNDSSSTESTPKGVKPVQTSPLPLNSVIACSPAHSSVGPQASELSSEDSVPSVATSRTSSRNSVINLPGILPINKRRTVKNDKSKIIEATENSSGNISTMNHGRGRLLNLFKSQNSNHATVPTNPSCISRSLQGSEDVVPNSAAPLSVSMFHVLKGRGRGRGEVIGSLILREPKVPSFYEEANQEGLKGGSENLQQRSDDGYSQIAHASPEGLGRVRQVSVGRGNISGMKITIPRQSNETVLSDHSDSSLFTNSRKLHLENGQTVQNINSYSGKSLPKDPSEVDSVLKNSGPNRQSKKDQYSDASVSAQSDCFTYNSTHMVDQESTKRLSGGHCGDLTPKNLPTGVISATPRSSQGEMTNDSDLTPIKSGISSSTLGAKIAAAYDKIKSSANLRDESTESESESETLPKAKLQDVSGYVDDSKCLDYSSSVSEEDGASAAVEKTHLDFISDPVSAKIAQQFDARIGILHGSTDINPAEYLSALNLNERICQTARWFKVDKLTKPQCLAMPAILERRNVVIISPNKTRKPTGFVIPILNLLMDENFYSHLRKGSGPRCVFLVPSSERAKKLGKLCSKFGARLSTLITHGGGLELERRDELSAGCDVLITTPRCWLRLLRYPTVTNLIRLCHLVLDSFDVLTNLFTPELTDLSNKISAMTMMRLDKGDAVSNLVVQTVVSSQQWSPEVENMATKILPDPVVIFTSYVEASLYAGIKPSVTVVVAANKMNKLLEFIEEHSSKKIVVLCNTPDEVIEVRKACAVDYFALVAHERMEKSLLAAIEPNWRTSKYPPLLISSDAVLAELGITNAQVLIHFSLPANKTSFSERFVVLRDHIPDRILNPKADVPNCTVLIIFDEGYESPFPFMVDFLRRISNQIPERVFDAAKVVQRRKEEAKTDVPFCENLLQMGMCYKATESCRARHVVLPAVDEPDGVITKGFIKVKIMHVHSAVKYSARILAYKCTPDGSGPWTKVETQVFVTTSLALASHFSDPKNRRHHGRVRIGDMAAFRDNTDLNFHRARVVEVTKWTDRGEPCEVKIFLVDEGRDERVQTHTLYELPREMKKTPDQAVLIYLANLKPIDLDTSWSYTAYRVVDKAVEKVDKEEDENQETIAEVLFTIGQNCIVKNVRWFRNNTYSRSFSLDLRKLLLDSKCAIDNPQYLNFLAEQVPTTKREQGRSYKRQELKQSSTRVVIGEEKSEPFTWAHLKDEGYSCVNTIHIESPSCFYITLIDFRSRLVILENELEKSLRVSKCVLTDPKIGNLCAVKFQPESDSEMDSVWNRAIIHDVQDEDAEVFFVDYGDRKRLPLTELFAIPSTFVIRLPFQVIECKLYGIDHGPYSEKGWQDAAIEAFCTLTSNETNKLYAKVMDTDLKATRTGGKCYHVILLDVNGEAAVVLNKKLIDLGVGYIIDKDSLEIDEDELREVYNKFRAAETNGALHPASDGNSLESNAFAATSSFDSDNMDTDDEFMEFVEPHEKLIDLGVGAISHKGSVQIDEDKRCEVYNKFGAVETNDALPPTDDKNWFNSINWNDMSMDDEYDELLEFVNHFSPLTGTVISRIPENRPAVTSTPPALYQHTQHQHQQSAPPPALPALTQQREEHLEAEGTVPSGAPTINTLPTSEVPLLVRISKFKTPFMYWRQNNDTVTIKYIIPSLQKYEVIVSSTSVIFRAIVDDKCERHEYWHRMNLFGPVHECFSSNLTASHLMIVLYKRLRGYAWPRLQYSKHTDNRIRIDPESSISSLEVMEGSTLSSPDCRRCTDKVDDESIEYSSKRANLGGYSLDFHYPDGYNASDDESEDTFYKKISGDVVDKFDPLGE